MWTYRKNGQGLKREKKGKTKDDRPNGVTTQWEAQKKGERGGN